MPKRSPSAYSIKSYSGPQSPIVSGQISHAVFRILASSVSDVFKKTPRKYTFMTNPQLRLLDVFIPQMFVVRDSGACALPQSFFVEFVVGYGWFFWCFVFGQRMDGLKAVDFRRFVATKDEKRSQGEYNQIFKLGNHWLLGFSVFLKDCIWLAISTYVIDQKKVEKD